MGLGEKFLGKKGKEGYDFRSKGTDT